MLHPFPTAFRKISAPCTVSGPVWRDTPDTKPPCFSNHRLRPFASQGQAALAPGTSPCRPSSSPSQRQQASAQSVPRTSSSSAWELVANAHPQAPAGSPGAETLWAGPRWLLSPRKSKKHYSSCACSPATEASLPSCPACLLGLLACTQVPPQAWGPHPSWSLVPRTTQAMQQEFSKYLWVGLLNLFSKSCLAGTMLCKKDQSSTALPVTAYTAVESGTRCDRSMWSHGWGLLTWGDTWFTLATRQTTTWHQFLHQLTAYRLP